VLGLTAASEKKVDKAVEHLRKALGMDPRQLDIRMALANIFANAKRYNEALTELKAIRKKAPKAQGIDRAMCQIYHQKKDKAGKDVCLAACKEVGISAKDCSIP